MPDRAPWLVVGVGNELLTDEGVGVAAARALATLDLPDVEVLDGGTIGLGLLPLIEDREGVLVLDAAIREGADAGDLVVLVGDEVGGGGWLVASPHQVGIVQALAATELTGRAPTHVAVVGMVPTSLEIGYGLSPAASSQLVTMTETALELLAGWGVEVHQVA